MNTKTSDFTPEQINSVLDDPRLRAEFDKTTANGTTNLSWENYKLRVRWALMEGTFPLDEMLKKPM